MICLFFNLLPRPVPLATVLPGFLGALGAAALAALYAFTLSITVLPCFLIASRVPFDASKRAAAASPTGIGIIKYSLVLGS